MNRYDCIPIKLYLLKKEKERICGASLLTSVLKIQEIREYFHQPNTEEDKLIQDSKMNFSQ